MRVESPVVVFLLSVVKTEPGAVKTHVLQLLEAGDNSDDLTAEPAIVCGGQIDLLQALL